MVLGVIPGNRKKHTPDLSIFSLSYSKPTVVTGTYYVSETQGSKGLQ